MTSEENEVIGVRLSKSLIRRMDQARERIEVVPNRSVFIRHLLEVNLPPETKKKRGPK